MEKFVIVMDNHYTGYNLYKSKGCRMVDPYGILNENRFARKIRSILFKVNKKWSFGINKELKNCAETYLIYDHVSPAVVHYIRKNNPDSRIIVYYINPIKYSFSLESYDGSGAEIWSFDDQDAQKYGLKWNPLHYFGEFVDTEHPKKYDAVFVGKDKGRYEFLKKLENTLNEKHLTCNFYITPNSNNAIADGVKYKPLITYKENIDKVLEGRAIIDILQEGQYGYTMRIPESMVNHIKLITNNTHIEQYDFYCKDNIFILGKDPIDTIYDFIKSDWNHQKDKIIENLQYEYWIKQFGI